jgi:peptidyl-prolyl cis-trans isomerase D
MITVMRKHHKWLMIVISILAIPFIFYFVQQPDYGAIRSTDLGRIYDRPITNVEFQRSARLLTLAQMLGLTYAQELMMRAMSENDAYINFTFNRLVLHHEAKKLGIEPSSDEIFAFVKTLRPFQGEQGAFDPNKYLEFAQTRLPALGFTEAQLEELVSDQLSLNRLKDLLGTGLHVADSETREYYEKAYGKIHVAAIRLREEDFQKDVNITDEEIAQHYEAKKAELKSEEKRRVEFVTFALNEAEKKLEGKERVDALQKAANRANDFVQAVLEKGASFGEVALRFQVPLSGTGEFTAAVPDPNLAATPQLAQYAFQLTEKEPVSDALQSPDGFYVLHLLAINAARPLTLEEAKPKIVETLKKAKLRQLISAKGAEVVRLIREATNAGTPLDNVLSQAGLKADRLTPFSIFEVEPPKPEEKKEEIAPDLSIIKSSVREVKAGESTEFVPSGNGGFVAVVEKREPADPAGYEAAKAEFEKNYLTNKRAAVFDEWLRDRRQAARLQGPPPEVKPS